MTCDNFAKEPYFLMRAPYPQLQTSIILKNPDVGDGEAILDTVSILRAIDGTPYSYCKTKGGRRKLTWSFLLSRNKCIELQGFIQSYFASQIYVVDHNGRIWVGNFTSNPFDFAGKERAGPALQNWPAAEWYTFSVEFSGIEQTQDE